jgi:chromosome segregation and condensation protein ScpB
MSLKAKIEAIIYAAEAPVTLDQMLALVKESSGISDAQQLRRKRTPQHGGVRKAGVGIVRERLAPGRVATTGSTVRDDQR